MIIMFPAVVFSCPTTLFPGYALLGDTTVCELLQSDRLFNKGENAEGRKPVKPGINNKNVIIQL